MPLPSSLRHLSAAVLLAISFLVASLAAAPPAGAEPSPAEQEMATMVNDFRIERGLAPLPLDSGMSSDSRAWSQHMAAHGLAHDPNSGRTCDRFPQRTRCAENVGYGSHGFHSVQHGFEASWSHRAILLCDCTHMGIGVVVTGNGTYVTQRFVHDGQSSSPPMFQSMSDAQVDAAESYVKAAFTDLLRRSPSSADLEHWRVRVGSSYQRTRFANALAYSNEWLAAVVSGYYEAALDRPADAEGIRYWSDLIRRRALAPADVAARFYASDEYFDARGRDLGRWIDDLYEELLGRRADDAGRAHWAGLAASYGRRAVSGAFYNSTESLRVRVDDVYRYLLGRPADGAGRDHWIGVLRATRSDVDLVRSLATSSEYRRRALDRF